VAAMLNYDLETQVVSQRVWMTVVNAVLKALMRLNQWDVMVSRDRAKCFILSKMQVELLLRKKFKGSLLLFNVKQWMRYGIEFNGIWAARSEILCNNLLTYPCPRFIVGSHHYVVDVLLSMHSALLQRRMEQPTNNSCLSVISA